MDLNQIDWAIVGKAAAVLAAVLVALYLYDRREKRRKKALEFADLMRDWGLKWFAEGYRQYAVGDYSGIAYKLYEVASAVNSAETVLTKLDACFWVVLEHYKGDPAKLAKIYEKLGPSFSPTPPATPPPPFVGT